MEKSTGLRELYRRAGLSRPYISPDDLEQLGTFWIDNYAALASLMPEYEGGMIFGIIPLEGDMAGVPHCLELTATTSRRRLGVVIQDHGGRVGPCVLVRFRISMVQVVWMFGERQPDGTVWHELSHAEPYVPETGDPDPDPT